MAPARMTSFSFALGELVEHLGGRHRVGRDAVDERSLQVLGQPGERRAFDGAARKGVLEDAQVHAGLARFRAQLGHAAHFQTTVLSDDDRFGLRQLRGDFGDYRLLPVKIETQGLPPFVKAAGQKGPRRPRRPCIQD